MISRSVNDVIVLSGEWKGTLKEYPLNRGSYRMVALEVSWYRRDIDVIILT